MNVPIKRVIYLVSISIFIGSFVFAQNSSNHYGIIPCPVSLKNHEGKFMLSSKTIIRTDSVKNKSVKFLLNYLSQNYHLQNKPATLENENTLNSTIDIICKENQNLPEEGYQLLITSKKITLSGKGAGLFYGIQTFIQLIAEVSNDQYALPCMEIKDYPRFKYRGLLLDVSRHFFNVSEVKQLIDLMAQYKLNTFQWHLVDNQGWRIEIKKYPKLTSVGGHDINTVVDGNRDELDGVSTGGFYTQEQIKEIVRYADDRFITIVPEIEMPAHSVAALRAYPEFKCVLPENSKNLWANRIIYCPSEQTFKFLEDVIDEVITLFPGKYIHIGGDEAIKTPWEESAFCQDLMKKLQIKDVYGLQSYFLQRMEKYINSKNRSIIGWDEISQGGLAQNATVTCRFGEREALKIIQKKHDVIMGPGSQGLYFDYPQSNSSAEPTFHGRYPTSLLKTYNYNPVPQSLTQDEKKLILGVQASIWTEHIATTNKLYFRTVPRIFALAEIAWTLPENKNQKDFFEVSVPKHLYYFEKKGYTFWVPTAFYETDNVLFGSKITLQNQSTMINSKTYYTLNGHTPTECDREFTQPLEFNIPKNERRELQTIVITSTGKRSMPTRTVMFNYDPFPSASITEIKPGIYYRTYKIDPQDTAMVHPISASGVLTNLKIDSLIKGLRNFKIICEGFINAHSDDIYRFYLPTNNENKLFIDGKSIIADDRNFSRFDKIGAVPLKKGYHKFRLEYITEGNPTEIPLYMQTANSEKLKISPDLLFH